MSERLDIHLHLDEHQFSTIVRALSLLLEKADRIMADLSELQAAVARETTVINGAIVLLQGLKAQLDAALTDPVALKALSDQIGATTDGLAQAIIDNTPASTP